MFWFPQIRFTDGHCSRCLLYSDVEYNLNATSAALYFRIEFGEQEVCEYTIAVASVFCLIYPLLAAAAYLLLYRRDSQEMREENKIDLGHFLFLLHIVVELAIVILVLVSSCMVSHGFKLLCDSLLKGRDTTPKILDSCSDAQDFEDWRGYDGSNFYTSLSVATAGSWFQFVAWLMQGLLGLWKLWRLNMLPVLPGIPCCIREE
ncbi:transmembrane protein 179 [Plakobranchus ocellatus]|uniref:Transmembrane protein 179 n=1 Tax=Plakobranchus ocellatus TaxID=259542 RepID=A0AAV4C5M9_9GAST|nr:transmembrane protein 179 [Plakobranchus ocellatus]